MAPEALTTAADPTDGPVPAAAVGSAPPDAPRAGFFSRLLAARGIWALADQGVCSLGNFATNFMLVRAWHADQHLYGIYALVFYNVLVFLNTLHGSLVTYPLTLEGAAASPARLRRLVCSGLAFTLVLTPGLGVAVGVACWRLEQATLLPWAILAMALWQVQETLRRTLISQLRHRWAIPGDALSFLGQAAFIYGLVHARVAITPDLVMAGAAATSGLAALLQLAQVWVMTRVPGGEAAAAVEPPTLAADAVRWWRIGRWLLLTCVVNVGTIYLTPWVLEGAWGEAEVASLTVLNTLLNLTNPVVFGTAGLIVPAVAAAAAAAATPAAALRAARAATVRYGLFGLSLLLPYYLLVLCFPGWILGLFDPSYVRLAPEVPFVVSIYALLFVAYMAVSMLNGLGEARAGFVATLVSSVTTVALVVPVTMALGLRGALMATPVPVLAQTVVAVWMARRLVRRAEAGTAAEGLVAEMPAPAAELPGVPAAPRAGGRLRVLVNAYAVSPVRGSEPGVGWGYCRHLAAHHDVTVLCAAGTPGPEHSIYKREVDRWAAEHGPVPGLTFAYVDRPPLSRLCQREDEWSRRTFYYVGYNAWQRAAYRLARRLHAGRPFDVVHQLSMTGFREPGYLWKLPGVPFVWGPIAGAANVPRPFLAIMTWGDRAYYRFRNWTSEVQKRTVWRCRSAARRASHIWTIGQASQDLVERIWGFPSETLVESGATARSDAHVRRRDVAAPLKVVWSSLHIGRKGLPILLEAIARLGPETPIEVTVVGGGPLTKPWKDLARRLGVLDRVRFVGRMPLTDALKVVAAADVMAFTSVQDGTPQAVLEAISLGLPVICHDCCGMGAVVTDECGVKVPLVDPETSVAGFVDALRRLAADPDLLGRLSAGAVRRTADLDWSHMAARVARVYERVARPAPAPIPAQPALATLGSLATLDSPVNAGPLAAATEGRVQPA
jgi:glycosyltransferase involved in cell wall biosynthesis/O-antigen/teichoic acid export membrane protein